MSDQVERFEAKHAPYEMQRSEVGHWVRFSDLVDTEAEWARLMLALSVERDQAVKQRDEELRERLSFERDEKLRDRLPACAENAAAREALEEDASVRRRFLFWLRENFFEADDA